MAIDFKKWNTQFDTEGLKKDVEESANGGGTYEDVPFGKYEVKIEKMELKESKKGDPMFSAWFKVVSGDHKDRLIFMNQVITQGFQIHIVDEFLRDMGTDCDVQFVDYGQYNDLILDVAEAMDGVEFLLNYGQNKKGYSTFEIEEIYE